jgi:hypothetical protein
VTDAQRDDEQRDEIAGTSEQLLERLETLKALEAQKRQDPMSSPPFHELATDITQVSREIFSLALHEERAGDALSQTQASSIEQELDAAPEAASD